MLIETLQREARKRMEDTIRKHALSVEISKKIYES